MVGGMEESTITKNTFTYKEDGQAAAAETAGKIGGAYPILTGVITKSWIWLLCSDGENYKEAQENITGTKAQKWWKTRLKLIDETKTERNRKMCTSSSTIKLSAEAVKMGLWNEGASIKNAQGNRGKEDGPDRGN